MSEEETLYVLPVPGDDPARIPERVARLTSLIGKTPNLLIIAPWLADALLGRPELRAALKASPPDERSAPLPARWHGLAPRLWAQAPGMAVAYDSDLASWGLE